MERKDLLLENAKIFIAQGKALDAVASRDIKVLVVGNPANTNAYIAMKSAPSLPSKNFTAMLRLDHNRALSQLAAKTGKPVGAIEKLIVWGNHSPTMYADYRFATVDGQSLKDLINDEDWNRNDVPADRRQARRRDHRGARPVVGRVGRERRDRPRARLDARQQRQVGDDGRSVGRQLRHPEGHHVRLSGDHGRTANTRASKASTIDAFTRERMDATLKELEEERAGVAALLGSERYVLCHSPAPAPASARPSPASGRCRCRARSTPITRSSPRRSGFQAIYLSGGGVAAGSLGLPDLGISNLDDVLTDVRRITDVCDLPLLVDVDTGFGASAFNIARTVKSLIKFGAAAMHIEDQVGAKRCGHRPGKEIVSQQEMVDRVKAAVDARTDAEFVVMARTDALAVEGLDAAIDRARACVEAGADMIFPEAITELAMYRHFADAVKRADPRQHHRIRPDAAVHRRRVARAPTSRSRSTRCPRFAR